MEQNLLDLIHDSCRLCLGNPGKYAILEVENLSEDIFVYTGVKVISSDNYPQKICVQCLEIIKDAKELKILAMHNDNRLRDLTIGNSVNNDVKISQNVSLEVPTKPNTDIIKSEPIDLFDNNYYSSILHHTIDIKAEDVEESQSTSISDHNRNQLTPKLNMLTIRKDLYDTATTTNSPNVKREESMCIEPNNKDLLTAQVNSVMDNISYVCEVCEKVFKNRKKFYHHQRIHKKSLACPIGLCGKRFAIKNDLEKHIRVHTGEKPYECVICLKRFTQGGSLKAHREKLHGQMSDGFSNTDLKFDVIPDKDEFG